MSTTNEGWQANEPERLAALKRQSADYLKFAQNTAATGQAVAAASAAFNAGYFALMTAMSADEVKSFSDHPCAAAACLAARRLKLGALDERLAERGAAGYYTADLSALSSAGAWLAWAARVRQAVGWNG